MGTRLRLWAKSVLRRRQFDDDLADEVAFHIRMRTEHLQRQGIPATDAERQARLEFGGAERYKEEIRDDRRGVWFEQLRQDLRYGARVLRHRPAFTAAATLTLALGIGATATVFALLDVVLLRPLPVHTPEELAHIYTSCRRGDVYCSSSYPEYLDYRSQSRAFADMAAFAPTLVNVTTDAGSWSAGVMLVSTNYFTLLGIEPHLGRLISPSRDAAGDPPVVLSHGTWLTRFGGDREVMGRTMRLSGSVFRIAGVAPPDFHGTRLDIRPDLWVPIENTGLLPAGAGRDMLAGRDTRWIPGTIGRLRPGVTMAQAQDDMRLISDGLDTSDDSRDARFVTIEPASTAALPPAAARDITRFVVLLMGGVGATLLIACANVAGLLLARGTARRRELELRRTLGAGRGRIVRQLLAEYLLLAFAGATGGILVSRWAIGLLAAYDLPGALAVESLEVGVGARVLAFAAVLLAVTGIFGLLPALGATRGLTATADSRTTGEAHASVRGQGVLLGLQAAVAIVLLVGAGLFIRSLQHGLSLDLGLRTDSVVIAQIAPALERYSPERIRAVLDEATRRLANLPGVEAASAANRPPLTIGNGFLADEIEGYARGPDEEIRFESNQIEPDYFRTLGIEIRSGREFTDADREGAPLVGIISETMARRYWPGRDPVGTRISTRTLGGGPATSPGSIEVVGVVRDVTVGLDGMAEPFVYLPLRQHRRFLSAAAPIVLLARAESNPLALQVAIRDVLRQIDPSLPVTEVTTLDARIAQLLMPQRLGTALLSTLGGLTVVLVTVGVVGAVGYRVAGRRREIGVRLALGARRAQVTGSMTRGVLVPIAIGLIAGVAGALALGGLVAGFLYGIEPTDIVTLATAIGLIVVAAGVASFVPAWRAAGLNPAEVLIAD